MHIATVSYLTTTKLKAQILDILDIGRYHANLCERTNKSKVERSVSREILDVCECSKRIAILIHSVPLNLIVLDDSNCNQTVRCLIVVVVVAILVAGCIYWNDICPSNNAVVTTGDKTYWEYYRLILCKYLLTDAICCVVLCVNLKDVTQLKVITEVCEVKTCVTCSTCCLWETHCDVHKLLTSNVDVEIVNVFLT